MGTNAKSLLVSCLAVLALVASPAIPAYETDQHTGRSADIGDSTEVLNDKVNESIAEIAGDWNEGRDQMAFVNEIYRKLGGRHWVDRIERWAMKSPDVDRIDVGRYDGIFADTPFWASRVAKVFGTGKTIRVNGQLIGSDKLGHFMSQGRKYYRRYLRYGSEQRAAEQSAFTERAIFGQLSNGIYSNADLVANYEGHRFFRSLFEDDIVPGKPAILRWDDGAWVVQRDFDWADHVNEYWDEALNVNHFDALLYKHMHETFVAMCPQYWERPDLYTIADEARLKAKYAHLQLRDTSELRLDSLCPVQAFLEGDTSRFVTPAARPVAGGPAFP